MAINAIIKLFIKRPEGAFSTFKLKAEYADGTQADFGDIQTERGAKMMLTIRAKQFGLNKSESGWEAAQ